MYTDRSLLYSSYHGLDLVKLTSKLSILRQERIDSQTAMDGSVKHRERLVPILQKRTSANSNSPQTGLAIAVWVAYVHKTIENGSTINDLNIEALTDAVNNSQDISECCEKLAKLIGLRDSCLQ